MSVLNGNIILLDEIINRNLYGVSGHNWNSTIQPNRLKEPENLTPVTKMEPQNYMQRCSVICQSKTKFKKEEIFFFKITFAENLIHFFLKLNLLTALCLLLI